MKKHWNWYRRRARSPPCHQTDAAVLTALAEAEFDAGNDDAAIAAADGALAIDPKQINALIQKGYALSHKVESGALPQESWKDVRRQFIQANGVENDHPIPLVQFYLTYAQQGERPRRMRSTAWNGRCNSRHSMAHCGGS